jgi:2-phospho-L-lactate transferase/gluconeogenesis factor (CofD/UPF0052 family)
MRELGLEPSVTAVAQRYADVIDAWVVDEVDARMPMPTDVEKIVAATLMVTQKDREQLACKVLAAAQKLSLGEPSTVATTNAKT